MLMKLQHVFEMTACEEAVALDSHLGASPCHVAVFILQAIVVKAIYNDRWWTNIYAKRVHQMYM